jgi:hypothetical protein
MAEKGRNSADLLVNVALRSDVENLPKSATMALAGLALA